MPPRKVALGASITVQKCPNLPQDRPREPTLFSLVLQHGMKSREVSDPPLLLLSGSLGISSSPWIGRNQLNPRSSFLLLRAIH